MMRLMRIKVKNRKGTKRTTDSRHGFLRYQNLVLDKKILRSARAWTCDITHIRLHRGLVYLVVIVGVCTQAARGWWLGLDHSLTVTALRPAVAAHTGPDADHSDQRVQYGATAHIQVPHYLGGGISMVEKGEAWQICYAERFIRTNKDGEVPIRIPGLSRCIPADRAIAGWRSCPQTHPLHAGVSDPS